VGTLFVIVVPVVRYCAPAERPVEVIGVLEGDRLRSQIERDRGEDRVCKIVLKSWMVVEKSLKVGDVVSEEFRAESPKRAWSVSQSNRGWL
jgi:hypothetical protein